MQVNQQFVRFVAPLLTGVLLFSNLGIAQEVPQSTTPPTQTEQQPAPGGVSIDPSAGPLKPSTPPAEETTQQPTETPLPNAPTAPAASAPQTSSQQPLGTAAAEQVRTAGGGASRPAGNAIAPVKQRQYRSLIIKLGAVAAVGIAAGVVYGLSRGTSSTPPHSTTAATK
jgi:cytoskeletal protein RodZ